VIAFISGLWPMMDGANHFERRYQRNCFSNRGYNIVFGVAIITEKTSFGEAKHEGLRVCKGSKMF
jgi:hypothetical protein